MRVLVSGSRDWDDLEPVRRVFRLIDQVPGPHVLVHGDQVSEETDDGVPLRGLDRLAAWLAETEFGWKADPYPAQWREHGRAAGPLRNQEMVDSGVDVLLAFPLPGSVGTWDCIRRADEALVPVVIATSSWWREDLQRVLARVVT